MLPVTLLHREHIAIQSNLLNRKTKRILSTLLNLSTCLSSRVKQYTSKLARDKGNWCFYLLDFLLRNVYHKEYFWYGNLHRRLKRVPLKIVQSILFDYCKHFRKSLSISNHPWAGIKYRNRDLCQFFITFKRFMIAQYILNFINCYTRTYNFCKDDRNN